VHVVVIGNAKKSLQKFIFMFSDMSLCILLLFVTPETNARKILVYMYTLYHALKHFNSTTDHLRHK